MAVIDDLQILLTADATGFENVLKRATQSVIGTVNNINGEEVDWTAIFTGGISSAVLAAVAGTFASAIAQAVAFNNAAANINNVATPAVESFNSSLTNTSGQIYSLAESAGLTLGDTATAFNAFSKAGLDSAAATAAVSDAAGIARDTGESLSTVVGELVNLFQQWGVTNTDQVTASLTGLVNASQNGKFSFDELASAIADQGPLLKGKTNISDVAINLAALSTQSGLTKSDILTTFSAISEGAASQLSPMSLLIGNVSGAISSGPNGLITAFTMIENKVQQWGPSVSQILTANMGISAGVITDFGITSVTAFNNAAAAADNLEKHLVPLQKDLSDNEPAMSKLGADWNKFKDILASLVIPPTIQMLTDFVSILTGNHAQNALSSLGDSLRTFGNAVANNPENQLGGQLTASQKNLQSGEYYSQSGSLAIEDRAQAANLTSALIDALQNGLKTSNSSFNNIKQTFNLNVPAGQNLSSKDLAQQLYNQFNGL